MNKMILRVGPTNMKRACSSVAETEPQFYFLIRRSSFSSALPADTGTCHSKFNWRIFVLPSFVPRFNNDMAVTVPQFVYFSRPVILEWIRYLRLLYYLRPYHRETPPCCMITSSQRPRGKAAILGSAGKRLRGFVAK